MTAVARSLRGTAGAGRLWVAALLLLLDSSTRSPCCAAFLLPSWRAVRSPLLEATGTTTSIASRNATSAASTSSLAKKATESLFLLTNDKDSTSTTKQQDLKDLLDKAVLLYMEFTRTGTQHGKHIPTRATQDLQQLIQDLGQAISNDTGNDIPNSTNTSTASWASKLEDAMLHYVQGLITHEQLELLAEQYKQSQQFHTRLQAFQKLQPQKLPKPQPTPSSTDFTPKIIFPRLTFINNQKPDPQILQRLLDHATLFFLSDDSHDRKQEAQQLMHEIDHVLYYAKQTQDLVPAYKPKTISRPTIQIAQELEAARQLHMSMGDSLSLEVFNDLTAEYRRAIEIYPTSESPPSPQHHQQQQQITIKMKDPGQVQISAQAIIESFQERIRAFQQGTQPPHGQSSIWQAIATGYTERTENGFRVKPGVAATAQPPRTQQRTRNGRKSNFDASAELAGSPILDEHQDLAATVPNATADYAYSTTLPETQKKEQPQRQQQENDPVIDAVILEAKTPPNPVQPATTLDSPTNYTATTETTIAEDVVVDTPKRRKPLQTQHKKKDNAIDANVLPDKALAFNYFHWNLWNLNKVQEPSPCSSSLHPLVDEYPTDLADEIEDNLETNLFEQSDGNIHTSEDPSKVEQQQAAERTNRKLLEGRLLNEKLEVMKNKRLRIQMEAELTHQKLLHDRLASYKLGAERKEQLRAQQASELTNRKLLQGRLANYKLGAERKEQIRAQQAYELTNRKLLQGHLANYKLGAERKEQIRVQQASELTNRKLLQGRLANYKLGADRKEQHRAQQASELTNRKLLQGHLANYKLGAGRKEQVRAQQASELTNRKLLQGRLANYKVGADRKEQHRTQQQSGVNNSNVLDNRNPIDELAKEQTAAMEACRELEVQLAKHMQVAKQKAELKSRHLLEYRLAIENQEADRTAKAKDEQSIRRLMEARVELENAEKELKVELQALRELESRLVFEIQEAKQRNELACRSLLEFRLALEHHEAQQISSTKKEKSLNQAQRSKLFESPLVIKEAQTREVAERQVLAELESLLAKDRLEAGQKAELTSRALLEVRLAARTQDSEEKAELSRIEAMQLSDLTNRRLLENRLANENPGAKKPAEEKASEEFEGWYAMEMPKAKRQVEFSNRKMLETGLASERKAAISLVPETQEVFAESKEAACDERPVSLESFLESSVAMREQVESAGTTSDTFFCDVAIDTEVVPFTVNMNPKMDVKDLGFFFGSYTTVKSKRTNNDGVGFFFGKKTAASKQINFDSLPADTHVEPNEQALDEAEKATAFAKVKPKKSSASTAAHKRRAQALTKMAIASWELTIKGTMGFARWLFDFSKQTMSQHKAPSPPKSPPPLPLAITSTPPPPKTTDENPIMKLPPTPFFASKVKSAVTSKYAGDASPSIRDSILDLAQSKAFSKTKQPLEEENENHNANILTLQLPMSESLGLHHTAKISATQLFTAKVPRFFEEFSDDEDKAEDSEETEDATTTARKLLGWPELLSDQSSGETPADKRIAAAKADVASNGSVEDSNENVLVQELEKQQKASRAIELPLAKTKLETQAKMERDHAMQKKEQQHQKLLESRLLLERAEVERKAKQREQRERESQAALELQKAETMKNQTKSDLAPPCIPEVEETATGVARNTPAGFSTEALADVPRPPANSTAAAKKSSIEGPKTDAAQGESLTRKSTTESISDVKFDAPEAENANDPFEKILKASNKISPGIGSAIGRYSVDAAAAERSSGPLRIRGDERDVSSPLKEIYRKPDSGVKARAAISIPPDNQMKKDRKDLSAPLDDIYKKPITGEKTRKAAELPSDSAALSNTPDVGAPLRNVYKKAIAGEKSNTTISVPPDIQMKKDRKDLSAPLADIYKKPVTGEKAKKVVELPPDKAALGNKQDVATPLQEIYRSPQSGEKARATLSVAPDNQVKKDKNDVAAPLDDIYRKPVTGETTKQWVELSPDAVKFGGNFNAVAPSNRVGARSFGEKPATGIPSNPAKAKTMAEKANETSAPRTAEENDDNDDDPPTPRGGTGSNRQGNFYDLRRAWLQGGNAFSAVTSNLANAATRIKDKWRRDTTSGIELLYRYWKNAVLRLQAGLKNRVDSSSQVVDEEPNRRKKLGSGTALFSDSHSQGVEGEDSHSKGRSKTVQAAIAAAIAYPMLLRFIQPNVFFATIFIPHCWLLWARNRED